MGALFSHLKDARLYQASVLLTLLAYGVFTLNFEISLSQVLTTIGSALLFQLLFNLAWRRPPFDLLSAFISSLSLCLLLRTNQPLYVLMTVLITIASKFIIRIQGKHLFNPTNLALVLMLATGEIWTSPGQWGYAVVFAFFMASLGSWVVTSATRADVTLSYLLFHAGFLFGRSLLLGEPMTIPIHRLQSGALVLFAFFMISDPKTTPNSRLGRILFSFLVALGAWFVQFKLFRTNGLLWSLAFFSIFVPLIDFLFPGKIYQWKGTPHETISNSSPADRLQPSAAS